MFIITRPLIVAIVLNLLASDLVAQTKDTPFLQKKNEFKLVVGGEPFFVLGGELGNSSASNQNYLQPIWKKLEQLNCNTVLVPVYWELMEPAPGKFDFTLIDEMLDSARSHQLRLVLLWFGSWKNSMSCYAPAWVKRDWQKYPRSYDRNGTPQEILTAFSKNNLEADINAFRNLMSHLKDKDQKQQTVIMIQVENEIGMLPDARDYHPAATALFQRQVPPALLNYLTQHRLSLSPVLAEAWKAQGNKTSGTWEEVFGKSLATDEFFTAWHYAEFANLVAAEGKKIYPLPMFVNAALNRPGAKPGDYPAGGPLPHLIDFWKAAAPAIDFLAPDFYNPDFKYWNDLYTRPDNPLFIPEIRFEPSVAAKVFYAMGHYKAIGFSPFSIESTDHPETEPLASAYSILHQLTPLMATHSSQMDGVLLDRGSNTEIKMGNYVFNFKHDLSLGWSPRAKEETWPQAGSLILQLSDDEFIIAGTGIVVTFTNSDLKARTGILSIDEGHFEGSIFVPGRRLNGDQSHQGRHLRIPDGEFGIQRLTLYSYR